MSVLIAVIGGNTDGVNKILDSVPDLKHVPRVTLSSAESGNGAGFPLSKESFLPPEEQQLEGGVGKGETDPSHPTNDA